MRVDVPRTLPLVRIDGVLIEQVLMNLVENACRYTPPGTAIELTAAHDGRACTLRVRDHGPGFDEADLPFVFDRFYRAAGARRMPGSGLGLAIVRQAAEAQGGSAQAGNAPGGGALVRVRFTHPS